MKGSTEVGALTGKETGNMSVADGWTYLPQGTYTAVPFFRIGDETFNLSEVPVTREDPVFTVTAYAETSYSRYLNYKNGMSESGYTLELANTSGTAEKIMGICGIVSISDEVLSKNASLISDVTLEYGESSMLSSGTAVTTSVWYPNTVATKEKDTDNWELTGLSWGSHTISASFTFDGVDAKSSTNSNSTVSTLTCHITGLPFNQDLRTNSDMHNWAIFGDTAYSDSCGQQLLYAYNTNNSKDYARIFSPSFVLPQSVDISCACQVMFINSGAYNRKATFYSGVVANTNSYSTTNSIEIQCSKSWKETLNNFNYSASMSSGNRISVYHNEYAPPTAWYEWDGTEYWMYLTTLSVTYR